MRKSKKVTKAKPYTPMLAVQDYEAGKALLNDMAHCTNHEKNLLLHAIGQFDKVTHTFWYNYLVCLYEKLEPRFGLFDAYPQRVKFQNHEAIAFYIFMRDRNSCLFDFRYSSFLAEIHQNLIV